MFNNSFQLFAITNFLLTLLSIILLIIIVFTREISTGEGDDFKKSPERISKELFLLVYPNMLLGFLILILNGFEEGNMWFLLMLFMIFANDTFCYIGGRLFGKNNCGIIKASPNKSIAGYISGYIFTFLVGWGFIKIFKNPFELLINNLWLFIIISIIISTIADLGDLAESVIKRGAKIKDTGNIILGRGGIMDSIDSILTVAPIFYFLLIFIEKFF